MVVPNPMFLVGAFFKVEHVLDEVRVQLHKAVDSVIETGYQIGLISKMKARLTIA